MSLHKNNEEGFTITELLVVIIASSILISTLFIFTANTINGFMRLQAEGLAHSKLADASFRVSRVLRGANYIESASDDGFSAYAYFSPQDQYTSKIVYVLSADQKQLLAEVTPMTADYPIGTLIPAQKKTVVVVDGFRKISGTPTFRYYTSTFSELNSPVTDLQSIKNISVNLFAKIYDSSNNDEYASSSVTVNLRNRKTNL
jgi:type II secretory pathway pseudopilin PulG